MKHTDRTSRAVRHYLMYAAASVPGMAIFGLFLYFFAVVGNWSKYKTPAGQPANLFDLMNLEDLGASLLKLALYTAVGAVFGAGAAIWIHVTRTRPDQEGEIASRRIRLPQLMIVALGMSLIVSVVYVLKHHLVASEIPFIQYLVALVPYFAILNNGSSETFIGVYEPETTPARTTADAHRNAR